MINRLLANYLKDTLATFEGSLITRLVGLVKTVETDRFTKPKVSRFPVSVDLEYSCMTGESLEDLTPNQKERLIVYFEDYGATQPGVRWNSRIRMVAWGNSKGFDSLGRTPDDVIVRLMSMFIQKLTGIQDTFDSPVHGLTCKVTGIPEAGAPLFSRYTYSETNSQYLMPPYFAFALDLQLTYVFKNGCFDTVDTSPIDGC